MIEKEEINIELTDEMLMLLLRGGTVSYQTHGTLLRLKNEAELVIIEREDYISLRRNSDSPYILEQIFRRIDK